MIAQTLQDKIGESMKAHDEVRTSTLRLLLSALNYEKIAKQHELTEEEEIVVIRREVKQRRDSIEAYDKADRPDLSEKEKAELTILSGYLPPEMSDEDLTKLVEEAVEEIKPTGIGDMGKVIGFVKGKAPNADGGKIAQLVRQRLVASN
jgi:uncharacterized protein YqeY